MVSGNDSGLALDNYDKGLIFINEDNSNGEIWVNTLDGSLPTSALATLSEIATATETTNIGHFQSCGLHSWKHFAEQQSGQKFLAFRVDQSRRDARKCYAGADWVGVGSERLGVGLTLPFPGALGLATKTKKGRNH